MGEIADMMLDGTMDYETGEWNFDGEDGPGFPMTGAEAARWKRDMRSCRSGPSATKERPAYSVSAKLRKRIEAFGELRSNDAYHWQVRRDGKVIADWWPHRGKWRIADKTRRGNEGDFVRALAKAVSA